MGFLATLRTLTVFLAFQLLAAGCEESSPPATQTAPGREVRVASLVPAVTNMLLELGQRDMLVAVSNYDGDPRVADLPKVGDLLTIDWEQLAAVRPTHIIVQMSREKMPAGAIERADDLKITIVPVKIERLEDIAATIDALQRELTGSTDGNWRRQFDGAVTDAASTRGRPIPVLLALSSDLSFVAGRNNYLDDILSIAGGENVVPADMAPYPTLDEEILASLRPSRVVLILPNATEGQTAEARQKVAAMEGAWGLTWDDVLVITGSYAMVPGWSVVEVLKQITEALAGPGTGRP